MDGVSNASFGPHALQRRAAVITGGSSGIAGRSADAIGAAGSLSAGLNASFEHGCSVEMMMRALGLGRVFDRLSAWGHSTAAECGGMALAL